MKAADIARPVALTALLGRIHRHEPEFADAEPDAYIQTALGLIPQLMMDSENLRTLESLVLLVNFLHNDQEPWSNDNRPSTSSPPAKPNSQNSCSPCPSASSTTYAPTTKRTSNTPEPSSG